tara:strand:+ start:141 stop:245 length:105 start_codon:yes stop_codon:yes gene_type:complete
MKKLVERIILSDAFVRFVVYLGALIFTLLFSIEL